MSWDEFFEISKKIFEKKHEETAVEQEAIGEEHESREKLERSDTLSEK